MKNLFAALLVAVIIPAYGQNWLPINPVDTYHYAIDTVSYPSQTIWVDSSKTYTDKTVYYLNRIVTDCDTCIFFKSIFNDVKITNQPQFLQREQVFMNNGYVLFSDYNHFWIKINATLNDVWIFDSSRLIAAQVCDIYKITIFGQNDSVKVIRLSTNDTILLSKTFGIIQFPELKSHQYRYRLIGIESRGLGFIVPDIADIYNFNPGNRFQYNYRYSGGSYLYHGIESLLITNKSISNDSIKYNLERTATRTGFDDNNGYIFDTLYQKDQILELSKSCMPFPMPPSTGNNKFFNNQLISLFPPTFDNVIMHFSSNGDSFSQEIYGIKKWRLLIFIDSVKNSILVPGQGIIWDDFYSHYEPGLGCVEYYLEKGEFHQESQLTGYIKDGDTIGTIYPYNLSVLRSAKNSIKINNDPANDIIKVDIPENMITFTQFEIVDLTGKTTLSGKLVSGRNEIEIQRLPSGIYVLKCFGEGQVFTGKFIKE